TRSMGAIRLLPGGLRSVTDLSLRTRRVIIDQPPL
ncbi:hypothetical protein PSYJA_46846, partial [Pseudomonas syringae pv. japonica str. M301072]